MFSPLIKELIETLQILPGVGPKSARRLAFHLLNSASRAQALALATTLHKVIQTVGQCQWCNLYTELSHCEICQNDKRDKHLLCVVENPADVAAIEQAYVYKGLYFVLNGPLSPLDGRGPVEVGIPALLGRLAHPCVSELILATNPTVEGKATAQYIANHINPAKIKCSRIAYGVPIGGELEYLDGGTLHHAFYSRTTMHNVS